MEWNIISAYFKQSGVHALLGLSAYLLLLTGQLSLAQVGFFRNRVLRCGDAHGHRWMAHRTSAYGRSHRSWLFCISGRVSGSKG